MTKHFDVVALGEAMVEFNQGTPGEPIYRQGFGGDTSNAMIAAARQGARTAYLSRVGDDHFGRMLLDLWQAEGVDAGAVARDPQAPTGLYFVNHGPEGHAASACDTVFAAIETARAAGAQVSFDPNLRLSLWPLARVRAVICATIGLTDLFLPSLDEAVTLAGTDDIPAIFAWCRSHGAHTVVLKAGSTGAWYALPGAQPQLAAANPVKAIDATGAGDCFDGSLLARLAAGDALPDAVRYANASAALSTQGHGAVAPIPVAAQVRAALG
jgi:2-dehydro-3-deoxygluconokinase